MTTTSQKTTPLTAPLTPRQIEHLKQNGNIATDWSKVKIHPEADLELIRGCEFEGDVAVGLLDSEKYPGSGLRRVLLRDTTVGDGVRLRNIPGGISGATIGNEAVIENTARISYEPQSLCGIGTRVGVLDETNSREVIIYPGLSAQSAILMARAPRSVAEEIYAQTEEYIDQFRSADSIGARAKILDCGSLTNVAVGPEGIIEGATRLSNGCLVNNATPGKALAYIGAGVDAENFIIEDGIVDSGVLLRNCYVGQGARLEKGFTAHDSLFFANCSLENGEACALFAGPYTVSMHKGTLLIGCQTSFMNAGSSTNQSNHMYKLGPVHWGVLERGVKTSSNSYLMLGANIGAFSLLMGEHKTHPDSREFPFSYLFGDPSGATVVVPAVMLRSCGLIRDEQKWPTRDRRQRRGLPLRDRVVYNILNPCTVDAMLDAIATIRHLMTQPADDDRYIRYKGMKLSRASLERATNLYYYGIMKYLSEAILPEDAPDDWRTPDAPEDPEFKRHKGGEWIDLAGQPMPRRIYEEALKAESVEAREAIFDKAFEQYAELQREWIIARKPEDMNPDAAEIRHGAYEFDRIVENDRKTYRTRLSDELAMLTL